MLALSLTSDTIRYYMAEKQAFVQQITAEEYETLLPSRLPGAALQEQIPFSLLVRHNEQSAEAFRVMMNVKGLERTAGAVTFMAILLNEDFQPALRPIKSTIGPDNMWSGGLYMVTNGQSTPTKTGFVMPYEDDVDRSLLDFFESVGASH